MTNEDKILTVLEHHGKILERQGKVLENLQAGQVRLEKGQQQQGVAIVRLEEGQKRLEHGQAQHKTLLKVLEAGQNDLRENMATKADVQDIKAEQTKLKRRIENVEENTKTPNIEKH